MNKKFFLPAVALIAFLIVTASCGSSRTTTSRYPYPGSPYPQGYPYPGNYPNDRYPDYRRYPNHYPQGQSRKVYRGKSARGYGDGNRNRHNKYDPKDRRNNGGYSDGRRGNHHDDHRNHRRNGNRN